MPEIIIHQQTLDYIYSEARNELTFRLKTGRNTFQSVSLVYFYRETPEDRKTAEMTLLYRDEQFDTWECRVWFSEAAYYQRYYFALERARGGRVYYTYNGTEENEPTTECFNYLYTNPRDVITVPKWVKGCVFYQIFPERFFNGDPKNDPKGVMPWGTVPTGENFMGGDLQGIRQKIPYLKELGVGCVYLNPIFKADYNHKYATTDYYRVDPNFGTNEDLKALVSDLHAAGIRIVLDGVFNHCGVHFKPFMDALEKGPESKYFNWFYFKTDRPEVKKGQYECVGDFEFMPKLRTADPTVREFVINIMEYWLREAKIDGWRLDVADEIDGTLWNEARYRIKAKYPEAFLLGETWQDGGFLLDGEKMDGVMNYVFRDAVRDFFAYDKITAAVFDRRLQRMLAANRSLTNDVQYNLLDSHDTPRFLYFTEGNKARLRLAALFSLTFPGAPAIYYGTEAGMTGDTDPLDRGCMLWGEEADRELLSFYRNVIAFHNREKTLCLGSFREEIIDNDSAVYGFKRTYEGETVHALFHNRDAEDMVSWENLPGGKIYEILPDGTFAERHLEGGKLRLSPLAAYVMKE